MAVATTSAAVSSGAVGNATIRSIDGLRAFDAEWADQAPCRSVSLAYFFEDQRPVRGGDPYATAKRICAACPTRVRRSCLASSIAEGLRSGFFAGCIPARRLELRKEAQDAGVDVSSARDMATFLAEREQQDPAPKIA
jgi:Transcription factor WhiB